MLDYEKQFINKDVKVLVGIDEAGRGPLAGPVVASAVILPNDYQNDLINDSKKLTEKKREYLKKEIEEHALAIGVGIVEAKDIDETNIYFATEKAMKMALDQINLKYDLILTDAMPLKRFNFGCNVIPIIKGDAKCQNIAAASIIAKVTRDHIMYDLDIKYPQYDFKNNKGYGTKKHLLALEKYGPILDVHRFSYYPIKKD